MQELPVGGNRVWILGDLAKRIAGVPHPPAEHIDEHGPVVESFVEVLLHVVREVAQLHHDGMGGRSLGGRPGLIAVVRPRLLDLLQQIRLRIGGKSGVVRSSKRGVSRVSSVVRAEEDV